MSLGSSASTQPLNSLRSSAVAILMLAVEPIENHARSPHGEHQARGVRLRLAQKAPARALLVVMWPA